MNCTKCGNSNPSENQFCGSCGLPLLEASLPDNVPTKTGSRSEGRLFTFRNIPLMAFLGLAIVFGGAYVSWHFFRSTSATPAAVETTTETVAASVPEPPPSEQSEEKLTDDEVAKIAELAPVIAEQKTLRDAIAEGHAVPIGLPLRVETSFNAHLWIQKAICKLESRRSEVDHCQQWYLIYVPNGNPLGVTGPGKPAAQSFVISNLRSPSPDIIQWNEVYGPDGRRSEVTWRFNGQSFDTVSVKTDLPPNPDFRSAPEASTQHSDAGLLRDKAASKGYEPLDEPLQIPLNRTGNSMFIQKASCPTPSRELCQELFISIDGHYLGTDTLNPSWGIRSWRAVDFGSFMVTYNGPNGGGPTAKVTYQWDGKKLHANGEVATHAR
jgi:hypothetical protein